MKKIGKSLLWLIIIVAVVGGIFLFIVSQQNNTSISAETIDLSVDCSQVEDLLITKTVNVVVRNSSSRTHNDISVKVVAYDANGNQIKEKYTTFQRTLGPNDSFSKPVTFPPQTQSCNCQIVSSNPY
jgi:uncharacterized protein (UPF0333 family)